MWTRLISLRTGISGVFLSTIHKRQEITRWAITSFPVRALFPVIITRIYMIYTGRNVKPLRLRCTKPLVIREDTRNIWRILVGKPLGKRPLGRPIRTWEDNIVTCIPIARQRVGRHIPAIHVHTRIGCLLLGKGAVNTLSRRVHVWFELTVRLL
jgi:hypothetical protein